MHCGDKKTAEWDFKFELYTQGPLYLGHRQTEFLTDNTLAQDILK